MDWPSHIYNYGDIVWISQPVPGTTAVEVERFLGGEGENDHQGLGI